MALSSDTGPRHVAAPAPPARRPVIGITTYVAPARWGPWHQPAVLVPHAYVAAVAAAGGYAVLLPPSTDGAGDPLAFLDGLVFCGGPDLDPALYGQERAAATVHLAPERDAPELELIQAALDSDVPLLGICRGMQLLNVARGGTLFQHLPDVVGHDGHASAPGHFDAHPVAVAPGSRAGAILGDRVIVQSGHHQGLSALGSGLTACAWSPDGAVEAIEAPDRRFALGVLWHPEQGGDGRLFAALVSAARPVPLS